MEHWLKQQAEQNPDKPAIIVHSHEISFLELYRHATEAAAYIMRHISASRVALMPNNDLQSVIVIHALMLAGKEIVMINAHLTSSEIIRQMNSIDVDILITDRQFEDITVIDLESLRVDDHHLPAEFESSPQAFSPSDILSIMFTSGTTGHQKAVPQTYLNHYSSAQNCKSQFPYHQDARWLCVLPLYHISGLSILLRSVIEGFTVVLFEKFDAAQIHEAIKNDHITHISLVPQTLEWLLEAGLERNELCGLLIGGAKLDERLLQQSTEKSLPIYTSFGMTETCSQFITAQPDDIKKYPNSVGRMTENIRIYNPEDGIGEIMVRGDNVMDGYLYPETANQTAFVEAYFLTGDIGQVIDGYLFVLDRRKDLIISGGENIYPGEIEQVALQLDDIKACCVVGIADEKWGERPVMVYESDAEIESLLSTHLSQHLAKYKQPIRYIKTDRLHRTSNGKISRHRVKEWLADEIH